MKLLRYGPKGQEKPGLLDTAGKIRDLSATIADVNRLLKGFEQMQGMFKSLGGKGTKGIRGKARMLRQLKNIDPTQLGQAGF